MRRLAPTLLALLLVGLSFWLLKQLQPPQTGGQRSVPHTPDYYMENFTTTTMDETGKPRRFLQAEYMAHFSDTDTHEFQRPYMRLYREAGTPWHVRSERGWVSATGDVMLLLGKVHIWRNSADGTREMDILTEDLRVLPQTDYGETDRPTLITTPTSETRGVGMRAYLAENRLQLLSDVHTHLIPRDTARGREDAPAPAVRPPQD
ncbi:MAG: LPS export ABC transporter periplasmic protein LptC [Gammaproteobacteria bacterium]|nr:LPS export ABC transporter periplasmic protein LptC [Gammaproteobacteria bacterium]